MVVTVIMIMMIGCNQYHHPLSPDYFPFSLLMINLDSVRCPEDYTAYLHWAAVNITDADMSSGFEVFKGQLQSMIDSLHRFIACVCATSHRSRSMRALLQSMVQVSRDVISMSDHT